MGFLVGKTRVQGQCDLIGEAGIGSRVIGNIESEILVGRHHRQRFVMHIGGHPAFSHRFDDFIALLRRYIGTRQIYRCPDEAQSSP